MGSDSGSSKGGKNKNTVDPNNPKSGQHDPTRGRSLGYNDFIGDGMYGSNNAGKEEEGKPNYAERRANWNEKAKQTVGGLSDTSEVSDAGVTKDRAERAAAARADRSVRSSGAARSKTISGLTQSVGVRGLNQIEDVTKVQDALVEAGELDETTGFIGTKTEDGIKNVQKTHNLEEDGQINPGGPTESALLGKGAQTKTKQVPSAPGAVSTDQQMENIRAEQNRQRRAEIAKAKQRTKLAAQRQKELAKAKKEAVRQQEENRQRRADISKSKQRTKYAAEWQKELAKAKEAREKAAAQRAVERERAKQKALDYEADAWGTSRELTEDTSQTPNIGRTGPTQRYSRGKLKTQNLPTAPQVPGASSKSIFDDLGLAGRSFLQKTGKPVIDVGVTINKTVGPLVNRDVNWGAVENAHNYLDSLISNEEKSRIAANAGGFLGDVTNVGIGIGTFGASNAASVAGDSWTKGHQQGWSEKKQKKDIGYELGVGYVTNRLGSTIGLLGKGANLLGANKVSSWVSEQALSAISAASAKYGIDLLAEKDKPKQTEQKDR